MWGYRKVPIPFGRRRYTATQLAIAFGVDRGVVYWLASKGKITSERLSPRRLRFPLKVVEEMVKAGYHMKLE